MKLTAIVLALACVVMSAAAQLLLKWGMGRLGGAGADSVDAADVWGLYQRALTSPGVWGGLMLYGLSALAWLWVLSRLDVGVAYPLVSLGFVLTLAVGVLWLGEPFSWMRALGCGLIVAGVLLLAWDA